MKYFLFDIGNVLVDFNSQDFLEALARSGDRPVEPLTEHGLEMISAVERGDISGEAFVKYLNDANGISWTVADLIETWATMFTIHDTGYGIYRNALEAGIPVYTLSNIAQHHMDAIENNWNGFFKGTTGLFLSYKMGVRKPDSAIYRQTLDQLGTEGKQCFFIDDRPENIEAARAEGIEAHQFIPENHETIRKAVVEFFGLS